MRPELLITTGEDAVSFITRAASRVETLAELVRSREVVPCPEDDEDAVRYHRSSTVNEGH